jgi:hypothetical protein
MIGGQQRGPDTPWRVIRDFVAATACHGVSGPLFATACHGVSGPLFATACHGVSGPLFAHGAARWARG